MAGIENNNKVLENKQNIHEVIKKALLDGYITDEEVKNILQTYDKQRGQIKSISKNDRELVDNLILKDKENSQGKILANKIIEISNDGLINKNELLNIFKEYTNIEKSLNNETRLEVNNLIGTLFINMMWRGIGVKNMDELKIVETMINRYLGNLKKNGYEGKNREGVHKRISKGEKIIFSVISGYLDIDPVFNAESGDDVAVINQEDLRKVIKLLEK